ncbi:3-oxoadipate enol-lactonase [Trinickia fusca]|uniref:3-oxoadipate enol-lactonase n=1 Tax=Trinickia fusca TaxID=2419777 RepID=A0A494X623_9BURK|nr:3-oxoadipate enol-lactonase [Trinickia fusca]RKP43429.1 3-oxoadipate enol-lactonase [Trinickia fusca]
MPYANVNGVELYYRIDQDSPADAPWLVLSNALGSDVSLWSPQIDALARVFRVLRYDTRGHGRSSIPPGPYTFEQLSDDVVGLLDTLGIERAHFCGISMGAMTGIALAARYPQRVNRVVIAQTTPRNGAPPQVWPARAQEARASGTRALAVATMERWFSADFIEHEPVICAAIRDVITHTDREGYANCCEAIGAADLTAYVARIAAPVLVIGGTHDVAALPEQTRALAAALADGRHVELDAFHISNVERAEEFTQALLAFLNGNA